MIRLMRLYIAPTEYTEQLEEALLNLSELDLVENSVSFEGSVKGATEALQASAAAVGAFNERRSGDYRPPGCARLTISRGHYSHLIDGAYLPDSSDRTRCCSIKSGNMSRKFCRENCANGVDSTKPNSCFSCWRSTAPVSKSFSRSSV